ncbi:MAG: alpha/beta fold hydrolase [Dehalococcoidia bacterium]|nr:alpha/beta fold hydrolase [Dehalococcoidia bacterium]
MSVTVSLFRALFAFQDVLHPVTPAACRPDPAALGVTLGPDDAYCEMDDGVRLFYRAWVPDQPRQVIACFHGMGAYGGHFRVIGERLRPQGIAVYVFDLRGHGLSDGLRGDFAHMERFIVDLDGVAVFLQNRYPDLPCFLLGESLAASIVLKYASENPMRLAGIVLAAIEVKPSVFPKAVEVLRYLPYVLWNSRASVIEMGERERLVSRDPAHFPRAQRDPLRTEQFSVRSIVETHALIQEWPQSARRISVPCLILQGGADLLTDPKGARGLLDAITYPEKDLAFFPDAYHGLFYDPDTPMVLDELARWLAGRLSSSSKRR